MSMEEVELRHAQQDIGRMSIRIYQGAREEAESRGDAFWATVAAMYAMIKQGNEEG